MFLLRTEGRKFCHVKVTSAALHQNGYLTLGKRSRTVLSLALDPVTHECLALRSHRQALNKWNNFRTGLFSFLRHFVNTVTDVVSHFFFHVGYCQTCDITHFYTSI
jgi:hypothetical protein